MADNLLRVKILADTKQLSNSLSSASSKLKAFGSKMSSVGSQLQSRLALPLIAIGGSSIKMAADFDKSMTKIKTLVGVASDEVDKMSAGVKAMATEAGVSSSEAADALFFITSAGLRGAEAMEVLEQSTKAAALGLGDTATVADLATSALNAYGAENLSATNATDVLTSAVREGKLEAGELSSVMGQVLPVASNMGVEFHEVGAAFAAMSRTGTPAAQAATQLNSILMAIMKPTTQSAAAMKELGLSSQGLREQIKDEGLLSVFQRLKTASEGNAEAFERVFGNVRALKGIMDLTGASADTTAEIFERMANTSGITADAFNELQNSAEFQLRKGLNSLRNSFTELGGTLMQTFLPIIQKGIGFIQGLFKAFNDLSPETQQLALAFGAFAAVLPTILSIGGTLVGIFGAMVAPIGLIASGVAAIAFVIYKNWNEVAPVVVGLYNRFVDLYNGSELLRKGAALIKSAFQAAFIRIKSSIDQVVNVFSTFWNLIKEFSEEGIDGAFGDVLEQGLKNAEDISKKAGEDIGKTFAENLESAVTDRLEHKTVDQINTSLSNVGNSVKNAIGGIFDFGGGAGGGAAIKTDGAGESIIKSEDIFDPNAVEYIDQSFDSIGENLNEFISNYLINIEKATAQTEYLAGMVGGVLMDSFMALADGENFFKSLIKGLTQLAIKIAAAAAAALVLNLLLPGLGGTGALAAGGKEGFKALFGKFSGIPGFANGGIVSGPTLGLMGEYSGAKSNPEVIAPLDKLKGMIGQSSQNVNVGGEFRIQGQDLVVALQRAERNRSRIL